MFDTNRQLHGSQLGVWFAAQIVPINFALTARIRGAFTHEQLQQALKKLQQKHPPLAMHTQQTTGGNVYLVSDAELTIPVRRPAQTQNDSWEREVADELLLGFDTLNEPPLRLVWLEGDQNSDLIFVCPHYLADGLSAAYLVRDLLTFLGKPDTAIDPLPVQLLLNESIPDFPGKQRIVWQVRLLKPLLKILLIWKLKIKRQTTPNFDQIPSDYRLLNWELPPEHTAALIARCRAENTTVHAALCAAFLRAFGEFYGNGWNRLIRVPVNLRKRLSVPVGEAFGLYNGLVEFSADCSPELDFWDVARTIKNTQTEKSNDKSIFTPFVLMDRLMRALPRKIDHATISLVVQSISHVPYDVSITNLGALPFSSQFGSLLLESLYGPSVSVKPGEISLGVITVDHKMHFAMTFTDQKLTLAQAEQVKGAAMHWLAKAAPV